MDTGWLIVGGVLLVAFVIALFRPRRSRVPDLGAFSEHWLAQHQSSTHDPHR
jgi:hypothetical protein